MPRKCNKNINLLFYDRSFNFSMVKFKGEKEIQNFMVICKTYLAELSQQDKRHKLSIETYSKKSAQT